MSYTIGQKVYLPCAYQGYHCGTVVDIDYGSACRYVVEFSSGMTMTFYEDELETA